MLRLSVADFCFPLLCLPLVLAPEMSRLIASIISPLVSASPTPGLRDEAACVSIIA